MTELMALSAVLLSAFLQGSAPQLRSLDKGAQSAVSSARQVTARDGGEWASLWRAHGSGKALPAVDFLREMVVGVFMGERPTGGFAVEIVGYKDAGNDVTVQYRERAPGRDDIAAQVIVSPYHFVAIPRRTGVVTFEKIKE
jgi:hypothetical protein